MAYFDQSLTAVITKDGYAFVRGENYRGMIDAGEDNNKDTVEALLNETNRDLWESVGITQISFGYNHTLALLADGRVMSMGSRAYGASYWEGATSAIEIENLILPLETKAKFVAAGHCNSGYIDTNNDLWTWGYVSQYASGHGTNSSSEYKLPPKKILSDVKYLAWGDYCGAAITTSGDLYAWGDAALYKLGNGKTTDLRVPTKIDTGGRKIITVDLSDRIMVAVASDGTLLGCGDGNQFLLSPDEDLNYKTLTPIWTDFKARTTNPKVVVHNGYMWGFVDSNNKLQLLGEFDRRRGGFSNDYYSSNSSAIARLEKPTEAGAGRYTVPNVKSFFITEQCIHVLDNDGQMWSCGGATASGGTVSSFEGECKRATTYFYENSFFSSSDNIAVYESNIAALPNDVPISLSNVERNGSSDLTSSIKIVPKPDQVNYPKYQTHVLYKEANAEGRAYVRGYGENKYGQLLKTGSRDYGNVNESFSYHMRDGIPLVQWGASSSTKVEREIAMLSCGYISSYCLLDNGDLYACGNNYYGQLGLTDRLIGFDNTMKDTQWHLVRQNVKWVSAFGYQVIVVGTDNVIYKAGINYNGTPGNGEWAKLSSNVDRAWATGELEHYYTTIKGRLFKRTVNGTVEIDTSAISYISGDKLHRQHITHCYNKARRPYFTTSSGIYVSDGSKLSSGGNHKIVDSTFEASNVNNYQGVWIDQRAQVTVDRAGTSCTKGGNYWCQCGTSNSTDDRRFESNICYDSYPKDVVHTYCLAATVFMLIYGKHNEDFFYSIHQQGANDQEDMGGEWAKNGYYQSCSFDADLIVPGTYPLGTHTPPLLPDYYPTLPAPPDEDRGEEVVIHDGHIDLQGTIQALALGSVDLQGNLQVANLSSSDLQGSIEIHDIIPDPPEGNINPMFVETDETTLWSAGYDRYGQLAIAPTDGEYVKQFCNVPLNCTEIKYISPSAYHTAVLYRNGDLVMYGNNFYGQLGSTDYLVGTTAPHYTPDIVHHNVVKADTGNYHTAYLTETGDVYTFGGNVSGELGQGKDVDFITGSPTLVISNVKDLDVTTRKTLVLKNDGTVWGAGNSAKGQLGIVQEVVSSFVQVCDFTDVIDIAATPTSTYMKRADSSWWIVGHLKQANSGEVVSQDYTTTPIRVAVDKPIKKIRGYGCNTYFLCEDGTLYGVGVNNKGQLGFAPTGNSTTYGLTEIAQGVTDVYSNMNVVYYVKDGRVYGCGCGKAYNFGNGNNPDAVSSPIDITPAEGKVTLIPRSERNVTSDTRDLSSTINIAPRNDLSSTITITDTVVSSLPSTLVVPAEGGRDLPSELSITKYAELPSQMFAFVNPDNVLEGQITINTNTMEVEYDVPPNDRRDLAGNIEIIHTGSTEIRSSINIMQHTSMEGIYDIPLSDFSSINSNIEVIYSGYPYLHSQLEIAPNAYMDAQYGTEGYEERNLVGEITVEQNTRSELTSTLTVYSEYTAEEDGRIGYNVKSSINVQANGFGDMYGFISAKMYNQMQGNVVFEELGESDLPVDVWIPYIDSLDAEIIVPPTNKMYGKTDIIGVGESEIEGSLSLPYIDTLDSTIEININNKMWGLVEIELPPMYEETLYAIGDSYINSTEHEFNFGEAPSLSFGQNDGTNRTLMAFLTEDIPDNHEIYSVYLRVFYGRDLVKKPAIYGVDGDWNELGVTWDNAPAIGEFVTDEYQSYNDFNGTYIEFDVTKFIAKEFAAGADIVDFYLVDLAESEDGYDYIYSRETPRYAPRLLLKHYDPTVQNFGRTTLNSTVTVHEVNELWGRITTIQYNTIDSEIAVNHWNQLKGTITTRIQGLLDGEIAVSRPNLYGSIAARQSDYEEIGGSVDIRIPAENDLRSKIGVNRWWLESELTVSIYTDYDMDSTIGIYGYGNNAISGTIYARRKDMIFGNITVSRPEMRGTIRVRNSDGNNLLGTIKVRDYSYKNLRSRIAIPWHTYRQFRGKISITRPSLRGSIFVPWHNDLDSTITVPFIGEDNLDSSIAISRPTMNGTIIAHNVSELNSKIGIRQEGEYNMDSALSISRPTMDGTIIAHQVSDMNGSIGVRVEGLYDMMGYIQVNGTANLRGTIDVWHFDTMEGTIRVISGNLGSTISVRQKAVEELRGTIAVRITTHSTIDSSIEVFNTWYRLPSQLTVGAGTAEMDGEYDVIGSMDYDIPSMVWIPKFEYLDSEIRIKYENRMQGTAEFLYTSDLPAIIGVEREGWDTILCTIDIPSKSELEGTLDIVSFGAYAFIM